MQGRQHLRLRLLAEKIEAGRVAARPGEARHKAELDRVSTNAEGDRDRPRLPLEGKDRRGRGCADDIGLQADQLLRERSHPIDVCAVPPNFNSHVAANGPT